MRIRYVAEFLGTLWLVFAGCGAAVVAASLPQVGIGLLGVALAFGLSVLVMTYAFEHLSGAHFNPAVTTGFLVAGRIRLLEAIFYVLAQLLGAIVAAALLAYVAGGRPGFDLLSSGLGANGYEDHSPGGYSLGAAFVGEFVTTLFFVLVALRVLWRAPGQGVPLASGLALTVAYLVMLPITNASLNPARSTAPALIVGGWALRQLWLFWLAPLLGAVAAGILLRLLERAAAGKPA